MICQDCGTTEGVDETECPYAGDVHGVVDLIHVCSGCYNERLMDI